MSFTEQYKYLAFKSQCMTRDINKAIECALYSPGIEVGVIFFMPERMEQVHRYITSCFREYIKQDNFKRIILLNGSRITLAIMPSDLVGIDFDLGCVC